MRVQRAREAAGILVAGAFLLGVVVVAGVRQKPGGPADPVSARLVAVPPAQGPVPGATWCADQAKAPGAWCADLVVDGWPDRAVFCVQDAQDERRVCRDLGAVKRFMRGAK